MVLVDVVDRLGHLHVPRILVSGHVSCGDREAATASGVLSSVEQTLFTAQIDRLLERRILDSNYRIPLFNLNI